VRGLLGEPTRLDYASLALDHVTVMLRFGDLPVAIHWIDLPGIARYAMEFALYAPSRRLRLTFPSPFLRNEPAMLEIESGTGGTGRSWRTEEITGYESGFKNELVAFHDSIVTGRPPPTSGRDGLRDITLCQAIIVSHHRSGPVDYPAEAEAEAAGAEAGAPKAEAGAPKAEAEAPKAEAGAPKAEAEGVPDGR